jgi:hypothetical protein
MSFEALPLPLRERIYHLFFFGEENAENPEVNPSAHPQNPQISTNLQSLFQLNHTIYQEASTYFYGTATFTAPYKRDIKNMIRFVERHMGVSHDNLIVHRLPTLGDPPQIRRIRINGHSLKSAILGNEDDDISHLVIYTLRYLRLESLEIFDLDTPSILWMNSSWPYLHSPLSYDHRLCTAHTLLGLGSASSAPMSDGKYSELLVLLFQLALSRVPHVVINTTPTATASLHPKLRSWLTSCLFDVRQPGRGRPMLKWVWNDKTPFDLGDYASLVRVLKMLIGPNGPQLLWDSSKRQEDNIRESVDALMARPISRRSTIESITTSSSPTPSLSLTRVGTPQREGTATPRPIIRTRRASSTRTRLARRVSTTSISKVKPKIGLVAHRVLLVLERGIKTPDP